jgi:hypothetical protein
MPASADEAAAEQLSRISSRYPESWMLRNWSAMSTDVMKSLRFTEFGPPSVLRIQEIAIPEPGVGEALVQVKAAAIKQAILEMSRDASRAQLCRGRPAGTLQALL